MGEIIFVGGNLKTITCQFYPLLDDFQLKDIKKIYG
jgi:hypothetical protein